MSRDVFGHYTLGRSGALLLATGWKPGLLLHALQCIGWPTSENDVAPNVHDAQTEKLL